MLSNGGEGAADGEETWVSGRLLCAKPGRSLLLMDGPDARNQTVWFVFYSCMFFLIFRKMQN